MSGDAAAWCLFLFEVFGLVVAVLGGWVSDAMFGGYRAPVMGSALAGATAVMIGFSMWVGTAVDTRGMGADADADVAEQTSFSWTTGVLFMAAGALTFCPHVLTSLTARELTPASVGSSAMGLVKGVGQIGGALAGAPMAAVAANRGWPAFFMLLALACIVACVAYFNVPRSRDTLLPRRPSSVVDAEDHDGGFSEPAAVAVAPKTGTDHAPHAHC